MGREIKRVAVDWEWPIDKIWTGYINPHWKPCPKDNVTCFGGATAACKWVDAVARFIGVLGQDAAYRNRGGIYPHPYITEFSQAPHFDIPQETMARIKAIEDDKERMRAIHLEYQIRPPKVLPLDDQLRDFVVALSGEKELGLGSGAGYGIYKALLKAAGITDEEWGSCPVCKGEGIDPEASERYEAWEPDGPPAGDGWQIWETVSEGSPISPVFPTREGLVDYLAAGGDAWDRKRGDGGWGRERAEAFVNSGWAPSMMVINDSRGVQVLESKDIALAIKEKPE